MLSEDDFEMFKQFRVRAMGHKLREMAEDASYDAMSFEEKMKILIDAEATARRDRKVIRLVKEARFKLPEACVEDIVYLSGRTLSKDRVVRWAQCGWIGGCETMAVISKTGCGKSYLAQALGNATCRRLIPVRYTRLAWICDDLNRARELGDGSYYEALDDLEGVQLLIIDGFMTAPIPTQNAVDLFEIMEAREGGRPSSRRSSSPTSGTWG